VRRQEGPRTAGLQPPAKRPDAVRCGSPGDRFAAGAFWRTAASLAGHDGSTIAPSIAPGRAPKCAPSRPLRVV